MCITMVMCKFQAFRAGDASAWKIRSVLGVLGIIMGLIVATGSQAADADAVKKCRSEFANLRETAYETCKAVADGGDKDIQKAMGDMLYSGWGKGLLKNYKEALMWYQRAAAQGQVQAKYNLGVMYENGEGTSPDMTRAFKWYLSAAQDGDVLAQFNAANMLAKGMGVARNEFEATRWYQRAAQQGDPDAAFNVANRYAKGLGIQQSAFDAYKWYQIATQRGVKDARDNMEQVVKFISSEEALAATKSAESFTPVLESNPR